MLSERINNILNSDKELIEELINSDYFDKSERLQRVGIEADTVRKYLSDLIKGDTITATQELDPITRNNNEAIINVLELAKRPALKIEGTKFTIARTNFWSERLEPHRDTIQRAITSVGRIEVQNHPQGFEYVGTGWLVTEDIIVTNRHVAEMFAFQELGKFVFDKNHSTGKTIKVNIDFLEDFSSEEQEFKIVDVLYIEPRTGSDIAFLKVVRSDDKDKRSVMPLATQIPPANSEIAVIGYPAKDSQRNPLEPGKLFEIFEDIYDKKRLQPGTIMSLDKLTGQVPIFTHDCSTLGGNSGSIILDFKTGQAIGLHFAGIFAKENQAVPAMIIQQRLNDLLSGKLKTN